MTHPRSTNSSAHEVKGEGRSGCGLVAVVADLWQSSLAALVGGGGLTVRAAREQSPRLVALVRGGEGYRDTRRECVGVRKVKAQQEATVSVWRFNEALQ